MIFCGRDEEIARLTGGAIAGHFAVVTSKPGMGATTLLRAGLVPRLRAAGFITVYHNEWQGRGFATLLKEAVAEAVREQADDTFFAGSETLEQILCRALDTVRRPVALLLDQFEDYLRFHSKTDIAADFDAELARAINCRVGQFTIATQEHAIGSLQRLDHLVPDLLGHRLALEPLKVSAARELVVALAKEAGLPIDDSVADAFANARAASTVDGVNPSLLVGGARRLLDAAAACRPPAATVAIMEALGGADRFILESLDPEIGKLNSSHEEVFFRWYDLLVSADLHRLAVPEQALVQRAGRLDRFAKTLLPLLLENGILRVVQIGGESRYELSRESMTTVLQDWWSRHEAALVARRRAQFRVRSMSIAAGSIAALYVVWLWMNWK